MIELTYLDILHDVIFSELSANMLSAKRRPFTMYNFPCYTSYTNTIQTIERNCDWKLRLPPFTIVKQEATPLS